MLQASWTELVGGGTRTALELKLSGYVVSCCNISSYEGQGFLSFFWRGFRVKGSRLVKGSRFKV